MIKNPNFNKNYIRKWLKVFDNSIGENKFVNVFKDLIKKGYKLTDKGAYLFHLIEQAYTCQYIDKTWRMALNNPWPKRVFLY